MFKRDIPCKKCRGNNANLEFLYVLLAKRVVEQFVIISIFPLSHQYINDWLHILFLNLITTNFLLLRTKRSSQKCWKHLVKRGEEVSNVIKRRIVFVTTPQLSCIISSLIWTLNAGRYSHVNKCQHATSGNMGGS